MCSISVHFDPFGTIWSTSIQYGPFSSFGSSNPLWFIQSILVHFNLLGLFSPPSKCIGKRDLCRKRSCSSLTIMSHFQCNIDRFLRITFFLCYWSLLFYFILFYFNMNLLISTSPLGHLRRIEDELFIKSIRNKFQPYIIFFTKYLVLYSN